MATFDLDGMSEALGKIFSDKIVKEFNTVLTRRLFVAGGIGTDGLVRLDRGENAPWWDTFEP